MAASIISSLPVAEIASSGAKNGDTCTILEREITALENLPLPPPVINKLVQDVITDQVRTRPNAPAICSASSYHTYKELGQFSSRLAARLVAYGKGPNSIVPILFDKVSNIRTQGLRNIFNRHR
jgi:non-ribosomal peptide synthetase component F